MSGSPRFAIRSTHSWIRPARKLLDGAAILAGLWVVVTWLPECNSRSTIMVGLVAVGLFNLVGEFAGLYRRWDGVAFLREAGCAIIAWAGTVALLLGLGRLTVYSSELAAPALLLWSGVTPIFALAARIMLRYSTAWYLQRRGIARGFAVVGANSLGIDLVRNVQLQPDLGLAFVGFFDDRPEDRGTGLPDDVNQRCGNIDRLVEQAGRGEIPVIFITLPLRAEERIRSIVQRLADTTASVYLVPDLFVFQLLHSRWTDIRGIPAVSIFENPFYGVDGVCKRLCDIALASLALALAALPMAAIAVLVRLTSRGPVIFRQKRYGLDGREIEVWKFRTMHVTENGPVVRQATRNDPRLTPIGGFLRRTSLDELPQLFNVLGGTMSMVGPRPHATAHNELYRRQIDGYMLRHKVKPGITGLAQVNGCRGETDQIEKMERRVLWDHRYIRDWSLWLDFQILFRTVGVVLRRQNAY